MTGVKVRVNTQAEGIIEMEVDARQSVFIYTSNGEKGNDEIAVGVCIEGWKAIEMGKLLIALGQMAEER